MENISGEREVELVFKCPSFPTEHVARFPLSCTVATVKTHLHAHHPHHPHPDLQRLIFAGRILNDDEHLDQVLPSHSYDHSVRHSVHLVVRATPASPSPSVPQASSPPLGLGAFYAPGAPSPFPSPLGAAPQPGAYVPFPVAHNPHFAAAPFAHPFPHPAHAVPHVAAPGPRPPVIAARVIQIDFGLILKLAFGVYLLSQGGGEQRLAFLIACAIAVYIYMTGVGRRVEFDENGNPIEAPVAAAAQVPRNENNNGNDNNDNAVTPEEALAQWRREHGAALARLPFWAREERGPVLHQICAFFIPLFLSLNPYWKLPDLSVRDAQPPPSQSLEERREVNNDAVH